MFCLCHKPPYHIPGFISAKTFLFMLYQFLKINLVVMPCLVHCRRISWQFCTNLYSDSTHAQRKPEADVRNKKTRKMKSAVLGPLSEYVNGRAFDFCCSVQWQISAVTAELINSVWLWNTRAVNHCTKKLVAE